MVLLLIRKAENKDIPALQALLKQVGNVHHEGRPDLFLPDTCKYNEQELRQLLTCDETPVFVAVEQDEVCGYAFCRLTKSYGNGAFVEHKALYLDDLCVLETCRGTGVGKALYQYVLQFAKGQGCYHVTLNVWTCNPTAVKFYEKMGLTPQKITMEQIL